MATVKIKMDWDAIKADSVEFVEKGIRDMGHRQQICLVQYVVMVTQCSQIVLDIAVCT
jgi:hypothetical protein